MLLGNGLGGTRIKLHYGDGYSSTNINGEKVLNLAQNTLFTRTLASITKRSSMKTYFPLILLFFLSCNNKQKQMEEALLKKEGQVELDYFHLLDQSSDKSYGFSESNPIKVGGSSESMGPKNERRFLSALKGPNGETVRFYRQGSCCLFETPSLEKGAKGSLDIYKVYWKGITDTLQIYINMYDKESLTIPVGLISKN